jgi:hypothetical protein
MTVKYLDPIILTVCYIDPAICIASYVVWKIKFARTGSGLSPRKYPLAILRVFVYSRIAVAIGYIDFVIW